MMQTLKRSVVLLCLAGLALQAGACAPVSSQAPMTVAGAYQTSNVVAVKPYTRTIFSSYDF